MTTHEPEITAPVDLCTRDGATLHPAARGWSRRPLHRANLLGSFGRNKRWDYWAVLAGDTVVSAVYADIDHVGLADVWWADLSTRASGGRAIVVEAGVLALPEHPGSTPLVVDRDGLGLTIVPDGAGTRLTASWAEVDGRPGHLDVVVEQPEGHESLNVVIPWDDDTFNYTSKHQARPAAGELVVGDRRTPIGGEVGEAWGVLDVGRGRWPSEIRWNWGGGAGRARAAGSGERGARAAGSGERGARAAGSGDDGARGHVVGLQFGARWTEGTGFTENGVIVDGRLSKIGRELRWDYDWDEPMAPWRVVDAEGQLDVELTPRFDKHTVVGDGHRGSETHQVFGTWSGRVCTDHGLELELDGLQGFAEEARQAW
jgi:hypothetical protein